MCLSFIEQYQGVSLVGPIPTPAQGLKYLYKPIKILVILGAYKFYMTLSRTFTVRKPRVSLGVGLELHAASGPESRP